MLYNNIRRLLVEGSWKHSWTGEGETINQQWKTYRVALASAWSHQPDYRLLYLMTVVRQMSGHSHSLFGSCTIMWRCPSTGESENICDSRCSGRSSTRSWRLSGRWISLNFASTSSSVEWKPSKGRDSRRQCLGIPVFRPLSFSTRCPQSYSLESGAEKDAGEGVHRRIPDNWVISRQA